VRRNSMLDERGHAGHRDARDGSQFDSQRMS
jgi:hypothetical protein